MSLESHDARFSANESADDDGNKETQKDALIRHGSKAQLWHDPDQQAFASFSIKDHTENHALRSKPFKSWIRWQFYRETEKAPGSQALEDALSIPTLAIRPDLGDRCLVLILPTISKRSRTT